MSHPLHLFRCYLSRQRFNCCLPSCLRESENTHLPSVSGIRRCANSGNHVLPQCHKRGVDADPGCRFAGWCELVVPRKIASSTGNTKGHEREPKGEFQEERWRLEVLATQGYVARLGVLVATDEPDLSIPSSDRHQPAVKSTHCRIL